MRHRYSVLVLFVTAISSGCLSKCHDGCCAPGHHEKGAKTLFEWAACKKKSDKNKKNGNGNKSENGTNGNNGEKKEKSENGNSQPKDDATQKSGANESKNGGDNGEDEEPEGPDQIATDRPDFTEASSTVGRGRVQLESGYTFFTDRCAA